MSFVEELNQLLSYMKGFLLQDKWLKGEEDIHGLYCAYLFPFYFLLWGFAFEFFQLLFECDYFLALFIYLFWVNYTESIKS